MWEEIAGRLFDEGGVFILNKAPYVEEENDTLDSHERIEYEAERLHDAEMLRQDSTYNMWEEIAERIFDEGGVSFLNQLNDSLAHCHKGVDSPKIKRNEGVRDSGKAKGAENEEEKEEAVDAEKESKMLPTTAVEKLKLYSELSTFMKPSETVRRTLKRLGPNKPKQRSSARKKDGNVSEKAAEPASVKARQFARLTELAVDLLGSGDFDIYRKTKKVIDDYVATAREVGEENELDAFGAAIDDTQGLEPPPTDSDEPSVHTKWLMKKGSVDADSEVEGPFATEDLKKWLQTGLFAKPDQVFVCRQGSNEAFRPLTTVDFAKM